MLLRPCALTAAAATRAATLSVPTADASLATAGLRR